GRSSRELAERFSFERVAQFLWTGQGEDDLPAPLAEWQQEIDPLLGRDLPSDLSPAERLQSVLPVMERQDLHAYGVNPTVLVSSAIRILLQLMSFSAATPYKSSIARTLGSAWQADDEKIDGLL